MTNILTSNEAAIVLRCETTDPDMLALLPMIDSVIKNATGHDWTADNPILPEAKAAARMLLVTWHENPGMVGQQSALDFGLRSMLVQLEVLALRYVEFAGCDGAGSCRVLGACAGDTVSSVVGIVGITGSQVSGFETVITIDDQIQQTSTSDWSNKYFRAYLVPLEAL